MPYMYALVRSKIACYKAEVPSKWRYLLLALAMLIISRSILGLVIVTALHGYHVYQKVDVIIPIFSEGCRELEVANRNTFVQV